MKKKNINTRIMAVLCLALAATTATAQRSAKRGFGEDGLAYAADLQALAKGCSWWYNWGHTPPASLAQYMGADKTIEFVPMTWNGGYKLDELRSYYNTHPEDKYLLGFNEPNFRAQSNMTPSQAAEKWPALEALADELGLTLVAPALNYPDGAINDGIAYQPAEWMDAFIQAYKDQNGGREPRMDYLALHCYMDQPEAVLDFCESFAKRYGRQVWLTEFCSWESASVTAETQMSSMIQKLTLLEQSDLVFRYAWFKARNANTYPYYNLVEYPNKSKGISAGTLTDLGFAYVHMSTFNLQKFYTPGEVIPVGEFVAHKNLKRIQASIDPLSRDSVELNLQGSGLSVSYQVETPEAGDYQLLIRASRPAGSASLKPRINILDANGTKLVSKYTMEPGATDSTYVAYVFDLTLPAGRQTLTIQKDNARACNISLLKFDRSIAADDPDRETQTGTTPQRGTGDTGTGTGTGGNTTGGGDISNDHVTVTPADSKPFVFSAEEMYYSIFLDEATRTASGIADDQFVNLGDNGTSQNSYLWENTFTYGDRVGDNSFGVTGNYTSLVVADKGWSGMGYNVNAQEGNLDLSHINRDYSLHMAVKSESAQTFNFYLTDMQGHTANIILGSQPLDQSTWSETHKHQPLANFPRDGRWYNIDIPMSYLADKFGLCFADATDYDGNILCLNGGSTAGTEISYDAIFFHGPKNAAPDTAPNSYDVRVTSVADQPFRFAADERYYLIYLDGNTKNSNLTDDQIIDCGPNGQNRQLYPWADTFSFPSASDDNSFGVGSAYMNCRVGSAGWSGLGYYVGGSNNPLNLSGITDNFELHFAVKTTYAGTLEFELVDAYGNAGWVVLGNEPFEGHQPVADFPRDGQWYNIDVPIKNIENRQGLNFRTSTNMTGNLFCFLAGGTEGTEVGVDAIFIHGAEAEAAAAEVKPYADMDNRAISIAPADENPFNFAAHSGSDYYVIYLDGNTRRDNIPDEHYINIGPNGTTQQLYPWNETVSSVNVADDNSFGVGSAYMSWVVGNQGWSGLGYYIEPASNVNLSAITPEFTLHFAVKSNSDAEYHYTVYDSNGKAAHLNLGTQYADDTEPIGNFERDGRWYNIDVPVSYLIRQGLDFRTAWNYMGGNIFTITAGGVEGTAIDYDAVFFYGPNSTVVAIDQVEADRQDAQADVLRPGVFDLSGRRVADTFDASTLKRGLYIVGGRKVFVK